MQQDAPAQPQHIQKQTLAAAHQQPQDPGGNGVEHVEENVDSLHWWHTKLQMALALLGMESSVTTGEIASRLEYIRIRNALKASRGIQKDAARLARVSPPTMHRKINRYGIDVNSFL